MNTFLQNEKTLICFKSSIILSKVKCETLKSLERSLTSHKAEKSDNISPLLTNTAIVRFTSCDFKSFIVSYKAFSIPPRCKCSVTKSIFFTLFSGKLINSLYTKTHFQSSYYEGKEMNNNPLISIIVPVYKVEKYLPRCIESILGQTYTNFELILVDDGTPDRSGIICDRYAEKDSRIKVIHKENGGVSTARNAGIDVAQGKWITFVDSDDWVSDDYLSTLIEPLENNEYDLTVGVLDWRYLRLVSQGNKSREIKKQQNNSKEDLATLGKIEFLGPCYKLYNKSILDENKIRFERGIAMGEDAIFVAEYLKHCQNILLTGKVIYHYNCLNQFSVTNHSPYFEDRKLWELKYIQTYSEALSTFGADEDIIRQFSLRKCLDSYYRVAKPIVDNFEMCEAKNKMKELWDFYSEYLGDAASLTSIFDDENCSDMAKCIMSKDVDSVYEMLMKKKKNCIRTVAKKMATRLLRPFIEKYRDGLIKFKF